MILKVPTPEDLDVIKLIAAIGIDAQPVYVVVKPYSGARINECFPNVEAKIKNEGGHQVIGWQIWKTQNLIEAEFHAVWRSERNELLDITPKPLPFSEILFLEDKDRAYSGSQVDNIRINISGNSLVDDLISVCEMLFSIENRGFRAHEYKLALIGEELQIWEILQQMKNGLSVMLSQGLTKHQMCFCGKDKYRKCHGKFLPYAKELV